MHVFSMSEADIPLSREHHVRPLRATFRHILQVVFLIFVFAVVQMFMLWGVCNTGMKRAASLERQGLPTLSALASLQEHLATYRLFSYEYLFAQEQERPARKQAVETVAAQAHSDLDHLKQLLPEGEGRPLAEKLKAAIDDLDAEFRKVRSQVDSDFAAAMKAMDQNIPPRADRVAAAAAALKDYGYSFSGGQANATFGSFGWIKKNAIAFGSGNILVALGAVMFVQLASKRSRAKLSETLASLNERTQELAGSLSQVHATLEATADGIVLIDSDHQVKNFNQQFIKMWGIAAVAGLMNDEKNLLEFQSRLLTNPEVFASRVAELQTHPERETSDLMELTDHRVFECFSKPQHLEGRICGRVWSFRDITEQRRMQEEMAETHRQLLKASREAGMAEVATNVLHNVGNVLNSVNISTGLVLDAVKKSKVASLPKVIALLRKNKGDLGAYLTSDPTGRQLPGYLEQLSDQLLVDQQSALEEMRSLQVNIEHIKEIVAMQQSYARVSGVRENLNLCGLVEDSLRMSIGDMNRHHVEIVREFEAVPEISIDRHKVLQVFVNLLRNAKHACQDSDRQDRQITVRIIPGDGCIRISVADNGVGIAPENMDRIFNHGFTTRKDGHGFGLHSGALAAKEMGGSLTVQSEGPGLGATFTLELPCNTSVAPLKSVA